MAAATGTASSSGATAPPGAATPRRDATRIPRILSRGAQRREACAFPPPTVLGHDHANAAKVPRARPYGYDAVCRPCSLPQVRWWAGCLSSVCRQCCALSLSLSFKTTLTLSISFHIDERRAETTLTPALFSPLPPSFRRFKLLCRATLSNGASSARGAISFHFWQ